MASLYGKHWLDMWANIPMESVKAEWQAGLSCFSQRIVFKAVDHLAESGERNPPTLPAFKVICKSLLPKEEYKKLPRIFSKEEVEKNQGRFGKILKNINKHAV